MEWTGLNDLREKFLSFFESKGHMRQNSYPLVSKSDKSLLMINSGMAPMKKFFLGQEIPPSKRVTTCQKCIRTPDIERVGKTARHATYFEMLGNFSFGDYFKPEAIAWAWEFVTEELKLPNDKIWISIYKDDDEAFDIWANQIGVPADKIVRMDKEDNFWEIGTGPCGPCSELYFDRGQDKGCGRPDCKVGCECDRFVEFWNLVFSQYNSDGKGNYTPMDKPNIDTGMGLERIACIMQQVDNIFEIDTIQKIMQHICKIAGVKYKQNEKTDVPLRIITDHIRSVVFMISDGIIPSNEGRGYVLRRLLRRAVRNGNLIGIKQPFLYKVVQTVAEQNEGAYPELLDKIDYIQKIIRSEEDSFAKTIEKGMDLLNKAIDAIELNNSNNRILSGDEAFKLYDTYGFPIDLIKEMLVEVSIKVDEQRFTELMKRQRDRARRAKTSTDNAAWEKGSYNFKDDSKTEFIGYHTYECEAEVLEIIDGQKEVETAAEGQKVALLYNRTPFYPEGGGQVSDKGVFVIGDNIANILDCKKNDTGQYLHTGVIMAGSISKGDKGKLAIDDLRRESITKNHTAAHLLQAALRNVLGEHVHQAGQLVDENRIRFDFNHFAAMTPEEISLVEHEINREILKGLNVNVYQTTIEQAREKGAIALFGEKYGDQVRVVDVEGYSIELCGGTHTDNTAKIGVFKIISESSVAAGIRRIEATTATGVLDLLQEASAIIAGACGSLRISNPNELVSKCKALSTEIKAKDKKIEELTKDIASSQIKDLAAQALEVNGIRVFSGTFTGLPTEALRAMGDRIKGNNLDAVGVFAGITDGKGTIIVVCGKQAIQKGAHAGNIIKEIAALVGGKGGGRPDSAMAGVNNILGIDEAFLQLPNIIGKFIKV